MAEGSQQGRAMGAPAREGWGQRAGPGQLFLSVSSPRPSPQTESPPRLFRTPLYPPARLPGPPALSAPPNVRPLREQEPKREGSEDRSQAHGLGECWTPRGQGPGPRSPGPQLRCPPAPLTRGSWSPRRPD